MRFEGKSVIVTGAGHGIGRAVAERFAGEGAKVGVNDIDPDRANETVEAIGATAIALPGDVGSEEDVKRIVSTAVDAGGPIDVLVNNAAVFGSPAGVGDTDLGEAHEVLETNLFGAWSLTQALLPLLRSSPHGRIVNVSSGGGQLAEMEGGRAAYRISKTALNALTRVLAADEAGSGVLVNSLCPGWVRTRMGGESAPRSVEEGADTAVWLATLPDDGPSGGFFR